MFVFNIWTKERDVQSGDWSSGRLLFNILSNTDIDCQHASPRHAGVVYVCELSHHASDLFAAVSLPASHWLTNTHDNQINISQCQTNPSDYNRISVILITNPVRKLVDCIIARKLQTPTHVSLCHWTIDVSSHDSLMMQRVFTRHLTTTTFERIS